MERHYPRDLYPHIALLKAAYSFTDRAYVHLDLDGDYYVVEITPKDGSKDVAPEEFDNEMIGQAVRHEIYIQTKTLRELLVARTVSSAMLDVSQTDTQLSMSASNDFASGLDRTGSIAESKRESTDVGSVGMSAEEILKDWFER